MDSSAEKTGIYLCDPDKNTDCQKTICFRNRSMMASAFGMNPCRFTRNPECAVLDDGGQPVRYSRNLSPQEVKMRLVEIDDLIRRMESILDVGIVNAQRDQGTIREAIEELKTLKKMI